MGFLSANSFTIWQDGQTITAEEYQQERSLLITAINDNWARLIKTIVVQNPDGSVKSTTSMNTSTTSLTFREGTNVTLSLSGTVLTISQNLTSGSIGTNALANGAVTTIKIADGNVTSLKLADGSVLTAKVANSAITTDKLADGAVTGQKIAPATVATGNLADGAVTSVKLDNGSVASDKIATGAVTSDKIASLAVTEDKLADGAVTIDKLADFSISGEKIVNQSITGEKLINGAVDTVHLQDFSVTAQKLDPSILETSPQVAAHNADPDAHPDVLMKLDGSRPMTGPLQLHNVGEPGLNSDVVGGAAGLFYNGERVWDTSWVGDINRFIFGADLRGTVWTNGGVDNITKSGFYYLTSNYANLPVAANGYVIHTNVNLTSDYAMQIFVTFNANRMFFRRKQANVWNGWLEIFHTGNDGPGSGLDADTLDGIAGNRFVYGSNGRATNATSNLDTIVKSGYYWGNTNTSGKPISGNGGVIHIQYDSNDDWAMQIFITQSDNTTYVRRKASGTWQAWYALVSASSAVFTGNVNMNDNALLNVNSIYFDDSDRGLYINGADELIVGRGSGSVSTEYGFRKNGGVLQFWDGSTWKGVGGVKSVQRGVATIPSGDTNISISAVVMGKSFVNLATSAFATNDTALRGTLSARLTSSTNLRISNTITATGTYEFNNVSWEVVEFY